MEKTKMAYGHDTSHTKNLFPGLDDIGCNCGNCHVGENHSPDADTGLQGNATSLQKLSQPGWLGLERKFWLEFFIGLPLFVGGWIVSEPEWLRMVLLGAAWVIYGRDVVLGAVRGILAGQWFDEFFLMTVASGGAFIIGEHPEAVAVMLFYRIGEAFQDAAVNRSKGSIRSLMAIRPDKALRVTETGLEQVSPEELHVGDLFLVKAGERVPVDGVVTEGEAEVDVSTLTGESLPVSVEAGAEVLSGSICTNATLTLRSIRLYGDSAVARILLLVEVAGQRKAKAERFVTKFSKVYTPAVIAAAVLLATIPPLLTGQAFSIWIYRALVFLVVSCPCALVISIPLGFYGGIGGAARRGILVKGGQYLDALHRVERVVFDKTGTLTEGRFQLISVHPANGVTGHTAERELVRHAAFSEQHSTHPLAVSLREAWGDTEILSQPERVREHAGFGVEAWEGEKRVLCGKRTLLEAHDVSGLPDDQQSQRHAHLSIHVAVDGHYQGELRMADMPRKGASEAVSALRKAGVGTISMLTGDTRHTAGKIAEGMGLDEYHAELLPGEKVEKLEQMMLDGKRTAFVGDGINDAPALMRADVGIAMGGIGSDAAMEAADIVLMRDDPGMVAEAIRIARKTRRIVAQNIVLALGVKGLVLLLGAAGMASMWEAVFADVGVALLAVLNATRVLKMD